LRYALARAPARRPIITLALASARRRHLLIVDGICCGPSIADPDRVMIARETIGDGG
jgi:hypothetical protein